MIKIAATAAAVAVIAASSAFANTTYITPGIYKVTTEYTAVSNDTGLCAAAGVVPGAFTTGLAYVAGEGGTIHSIVPQPAPSTDTVVQVNNLTCDFAALPGTLSLTSSTPYTGSPSCVASYSQGVVSLGLGTSASYQLNGTGAVSSVVPETAGTNTANSFHLSTTGATLVVTAPAAFAGTACTLSVDSLYIRVGK